MIYIVSCGSNSFPSLVFFFGDIVISSRWGEGSVHDELFIIDLDIVIS